VRANSVGLPVDALASYFVVLDGLEGTYTFSRVTPQAVSGAKAWGANIVRLALGEPRRHGLITSFAVDVILGREHAPRDSGGTGTLDRGRLRPVRGDSHQLDPVTAVHPVDECLEIGPRSGS